MDCVFGPKKKQMMGGSINIRNLCLTQGLEDVLLFSSKVFIVLSVTFKFMIPSELFLFML